MQRSDLVIKLVGLSISTVLGITQLVMDSKRKTNISDKDKDDIAERAANKVIEKLAIMPSETE